MTTLKKKFYFKKPPTSSILTLFQFFKLMLFGVAGARRTFRQLRDGVGRVDVFRRLRFFGRGYRKSGNSRLDQTDDQLFMLDV